MAKSYKDMVDALAGDDTPPPASDESDAPPDDNSDGGLPPEYEAAYKEYEDNPSAQTFWAAVEACTGAGGEDHKHPGLMIMIGKGKH